MTRALPPSPSVHHLFKFIHQELVIEQRSLAELAKTAGISYNTVKSAFRGRRSNISLASVEALMNALGYTIKPTPLPEKRK